MSSNYDLVEFIRFINKYQIRKSHMRIQNKLHNTNNRVKHRIYNNIIRSPIHMKHLRRSPTFSHIQTRIAPLSA